MAALFKYIKMAALTSLGSLRTVYKNVVRSYLCIKYFYITALVDHAAALHRSDEKTQVLKSWKEIPGPSQLPIIGQLHHFLPGGYLYDSNGIELWRKLYEAYGPIITLKSIFKPTILLLFDADSIAQLVRGESRMPIRPGLQSLEYFRKYHNKTKEESLKPTGLATDQGDAWKRFRTKVSPAMLQPKAVRLYSKVLDEVAQDMITRLRSLRDNQNRMPEKLDTEFHLWALESIAVVGLGRRLNCFDPNLPKDSPARKLIQSVHDLFLVSYKLDILPSLWRYYPTKNFKLAMKVYQDLDNTADYFVKESVKELHAKGSQFGNSKGVLEKLLDIDEEVARIMASDMLIGGVDTSSNTMSATLYLLAKNPDKQNKLRDELTSAEERRSYLKACIKESMRMYPVVGINMRQTTKKYSLLGYDIPKDTPILCCNQHLSMSNKYFPNPEEYIPERWTVEADHPLFYGNAPPFAFSPFGFGVRSCIGRRIVELELEIMLARIVENFRVEWSGPPPKINTTTINNMTGPFHFIFKDV